MRCTVVSAASVRSSWIAPYHPMMSYIPMPPVFESEWLDGATRAEFLLIDELRTARGTVTLYDRTIAFYPAGGLRDPGAVCRL